MTTQTHAAPTAREKAARFVAAQPTRALATSLRMLDLQIAAARASTVPAVRDDIAALCMTRAWIIGELEERHPEAAETVERAFEAAEADPSLPDVDYTAVLIAALPA